MKIEDRADNPEYGKMTVSEAGRLGGKKVVEGYGAEYLAAIGQIGGLAVSQDRDRMREIAKMGGQANRESAPDGWYRDIGLTGGNKLRDEKRIKDPDYYKRIGRMGAEARKKRKAEEELRGRERLNYT